LLSVAAAKNIEQQKLNKVITMSDLLISLFTKRINNMSLLNNCIGLEYNHSCKSYSLSLHALRVSPLSEKVCFRIVKHF